jgi:hypothetical protein
MQAKRANLAPNTVMKTIQLLPALALVLALNAAAQERPPARILPGLAPPPAPMPVDPDEFGEPGDDFFLPAGPDGMFMPDMPGRFQIIPAQIQQNGKAVSIVLKLDTQTGQVWQMKAVTATVIHNGKPKPFTRFVFEPVDPGDHPQPLPDAEPRRAPGRPGGVGGGFAPDPSQPNVTRAHPQPNVAPRRPRR